MVSNAFQWALFLTSVAARAYLNASRSPSGMCFTASMASRFSVRLTGRPAALSSWMKPESTSSMLPPACPPGTLLVMAVIETAARLSLHRAVGQLLAGLGDVALVLEQDVKRLFGLIGVNAVDAKQHQRPGPVQGLGYRWVLLELQAPDGSYDPHDLIGKVIRNVRDAGEDDLLFPLELRVVNVQIEATPLQRLGQFTRVVGRQENERDLSGRHRAELGYRHLVVREDLKQQGLGLDLDPVNFVNEQDDRFFRPDGFEEGPGEEELLREDVLLDVVPDTPGVLRHSLS